VQRLIAHQDSAHKAIIIYHPNKYEAMEKLYRIEVTVAQCQDFVLA
jgi:hypothetical protein